MHLRARTWLLISVLSLVGAAVLWRLGEQRSAHRTGNASTGTVSQPAPVAAPAPLKPTALLSQPGAAPALPAALRHAVLPSNASPAQASATSGRSSLRLRNSDRPMAELERDNRTLLLRNAIIDTSAGTLLPIPQHLRADVEPGAFIVQAEAGVTPALRSAIEGQGATVVSYLPHNAFLVRATSAQAAGLRSVAGVTALVAYEPYFKLEPTLLPRAVAQEPLDPKTQLNVTLFAELKEQTLTRLAELGSAVLGEFRTPFGPALIVEPAVGSLASIAKVPGVQGIEIHRRRQLLNDLTRVRLGISGSTNAPNSFTNYLGLNGTNVFISLNDSGVDATHPDLAGRVTADFPSTLIDLEGHGTHVAGTIAGSGSLADTITNAPGSTVPGIDLRGMAPAAKIFALPIDLVTGPLLSDTYLQETAATNYYITLGGTNLPISNNSWGYIAATEYTTSSASYDEAVRDALPAVSGNQPILYVFAAGNEGFGGDDGQGGEPTTLRAPATGKNVITVGALEAPRNITNDVVFPDAAGEMKTNQVFLISTDSNFQVTSFSSRGNVEPGVEGRFGRFKPDVVAPGSFIASTRSKDWLDPRAFFASQVNRYVGQTVAADAINNYPLFIPSSAAEFRIRVLPNLLSPNPFPGLPIYLRNGSIPSVADLINTNNLVRVPPDATLQDGEWFFGIGNLTGSAVSYDVQTVITLTNDFGTYFDELKKLNDNLGPNYRYESGTSMAAPAVTGLLALFQDYFQRENRKTTPALLKALLVNGARSVGSLYNFNVSDVINLQGWGLVNLTNTLPASEIGVVPTTNGLHAVQYIEVGGTNALSTGQSRTWNIQVEPEAVDQILKVTLVWTDPAGNPGAGIKLVNDLDVFVTDGATTNVYGGNDIPYRSDYNTARANVASVPTDIINNVENIILRPPLTTNYTVSVRARRVNVNAVTDHPEGIAQDFALVVSLENNSLTNTLRVTEATFDPQLALQIPLVVLTNGIPSAKQRSGAIEPGQGTAPGATNQWTIFAFTNISTPESEALGLTNGRYVSFGTFSPANLGKPRLGDPDVDLFVSTDPGLTNLTPTALSGALKSAKPGANELVLLTNGVIGQVYYLAVKSEDQQAGEYLLVVTSSDVPFDEDDENGNRIVRGRPFIMPIPDGSADQPSAAYIFGFVTKEFKVKRVVVTNVVTFDSTGDILSNLSHNDAFVVLNNHALDPTARGGSFRIIYDDSNGGNLGTGSVLARPSDGPGSLNNFAGDEAAGVWILSVTDNAITQTATNRLFSLLISPLPEEEEFTTVTIPPNGQEGPVAIQVPVGATNLTVVVTNMTPDSSVFVALRRLDPPTPFDFDKAAIISSPGGVLTIGSRDVPPLNPGRYYYTIYNFSGSNVELDYRAFVLGDFVSNRDRAFASELPLTLVDDALRSSIIRVPDDREIVNVRLGLRVDHPRVSDLVFHLTSPQGTRLLVAENRGGSNGVAYGATQGLRKTYTTFTAETNLARTPIKYGIAPFTNSAQVSVSSNRIVFENGFEDASPGNYVLGQSFGSGWVVTQGSAAVVQSGPGSTNTIEGRNYMLLSPSVPSAVATNVVLSRGQYYRLRFYVGKTLSAQAQGIFVYVNGVLGTELRGDTLGAGWYRDSYLFRASDDKVRIEFRTPLNRVPLAIDAVVLEEDDPVYNAYYLPEEPFRPFLGERALGDWKLEVEDTRAGPVSSLKSEVNWRLEFLYGESTIEAIELTNNVPHFDSVSGTDVKYFYVQVPRCATLSETVVAGDFATLLLFGDHDGLPTASLSVFGDDYGPYLNVGSGGIAGFNLSTNFPAPAPLRPGQRLYLAVRNFPSDLTNNAFGIRVRFDCEDPPLPVVESLTNGVPTFASIDPGPGLKFYQFIVSSNSIRADFELTPITGNVDMYVRYGRVDDYPLPGPALFDYKGDDPDPAAIDFVSIDRTSPPFPLTPGVWFVAVRNTESYPVQYSIKATEFGAGIINLTNAVPYTTTLAPVDPATSLSGSNLQYYAFLVSSNSVRAQFETYDATGDVNLYVRKGLPIPTPFDYHFAGIQFGTTPEFIAVTNTATPIWLSPGWWFLAVENADVADVTYTIRATEFPASIIPLVNDEPVTNTIAAGPNLDYYSFRVSPTAISAKFEVYGMSDDVHLLLKPGLPVPTFNDFAYGSTNTGVAPESIELTPFSFPTILTPGDWFLSVVNPGTNNATYIIRAVEETASVIPLTNGVPYNGSLPAGPLVDYYQFEVSTNATAAEFKLTSAGVGDLDLFVRKGPPLPDAANAHYVSVTPGGADEVIRIETNSLPIPLSPGLWYLTVTNNALVPVSYEITATEFGVEPPPVSGLITNIVITGTNTCITWVSVPGTNYTVYGKTNALAATWTPVSPTITAVDTSTSYCLAPPGPWRFFEVREGDSPLVPIPDPVPVLTLSGTNICVSFSAVAGTNYFVQAKKAFTDASWTTLTPSLTGVEPVTTVCYPIAWGYRFFRVGVGAIIPPTPEPLPGEVVRIDVTVGSICLAWPTVDGLEYLVEGRRELSDVAWTVVSEPRRGDGTEMSLCLNGATEFRYFRVLSGVSLPPSAPPSLPVSNVQLSVDAAFQLCLTWDALLGAEYFVEGKERLGDPTWTVISPILEAVDLQVSYCQRLGSNWRYLQVRRVNSAAEPSPVIESIEWTPAGPVVSWTGLASARYQVFYSDSVPAVWIPVGGPVTSVTGSFTFVDDGSLTGGSPGIRFYRVQRLP